MHPDQVADLLRLTQRSLNELFDQLLAELEGSDRGTPIGKASEQDSSVENARTALSLPAPGRDGTWEETGRSALETYRWPDGNRDEYDDFISYRGAGAFEGAKLALGRLGNGDAVGFVLGAGGGSKRGLVYFFAADDFETSRELVSIIRGGGTTGRAGFSPESALPSGYAGFATAVLRDRKAGKWNVQAVVVDKDDDEAMLRHTLLQARLRGLGGVLRP